MKETSKEEFERFKKEFLRWVEIFGLHGYKIYFYHKPVKDSYAKIEVSESGKVADVYLNSELDDNAKKMWCGPEFDGRHEAIHFLLNRLCFVGSQRFVGCQEMDHEEERLVRILEKVFNSKVV